MSNNIKEITKYSDQEPLFSEYLNKKGFSPQLLYAYVKRGWLERLAKGVYKREGAELQPELIVRNAYQQLSLPFHFGARTALSMQGISHFGRKQENYQIIISGKYRLNTWFLSLKNFDFIKMNIFKDSKLAIAYDNNIPLSERERAFIEMAELVPKKVSYEEFFNDLQLAPNLRPDILQKLLASCTSSKAKKIFLATAEIINHNWFCKLNTKKITIGKGILYLCKNGVYNKKYHIYLDKITNG